MSLRDRLVAAWYAPRLRPLSAALLPLSWLFRGVVALRRALYRKGVLRSTRVGVRTVVIGNLTAGGAGKTPLALALADALAARGRRVGLVSRGYGGSAPAPRAVRPGDDPRVVGDEPLLLAASGHPVWIGRDRVAAARGLLAAHPDRDVLIADDGLQHYALARDVEIVVVDAAREFGNGRMLPAGPLREPPSRLAEADALVRLVRPGAGGGASPDGRATAMTQEPQGFRNLAGTAAAFDAKALPPGTVHAIAGIGDPQRFFALLATLGIDAVPHPFPDHHAYVPADIAFPGASAILMTAKDAVKCAGFADARCWVLDVRAVLDPALVDLVAGRLDGPQAA